MTDQHGRPDSRAQYHQDDGSDGNGYYDGPDDGYDNGMDHDQQGQVGLQYHHQQQQGGRNGKHADEDMW